MRLIRQSIAAWMIFASSPAAPPGPPADDARPPAAAFYAQPPGTKFQVLFDQNNPAFYEPAQSGQPLLLLQHSISTPLIPFGRFAAYVGTINGPDGKPLSALLDAGAAALGIRTGYSPIPPISDSPTPISAYRLSINPDDPTNRQKDIAFVMPSLWLSDLSVPAARHTIPFGLEWDSLEYRVQLRVPLAGAGVGNQDSTAYVLGGLYFEQLKNLSSAPRPPALWYGVSMFDLRKGFVKEYLTADRWSGGTNSPIVSTVVARLVAPDDGNQPAAGLAPSSLPIYATKLDGSAELQSQPDARVRNFGFRISRFQFQAAVAAIKRQLPEIYGDRGSTPLSDDWRDYALTHFNLDSEIFHRDVLDGVTPERGMVVEFQNLQVVQKQAIPASLGAVGEVTSAADRSVSGWACFSLPPGEAQSGEAQNLLGLPVPLLLTAADSQGLLGEVPLARTSAFLPAKSARCQDGLNPHGFRVEIPIEALFPISAAGGRWKLRVKADVGSRLAPLPFTTGGTEGPLPDFDFGYLGRTHVVPEKPNLLGEFRSVKNGVARGWACLFNFNQPVLVDIVAHSPGQPQRIVASGSANAITPGDLAGADACGSTDPHGFELPIANPEQLSNAATLEAVIYPFTAARARWARGIGRIQGSDVETPTLGYFEGLTRVSSDGYNGLGWACRVGRAEPLMVVLSALMTNGESKDIAVTTADLQSEIQISKLCGIAADPLVPPETGYRYEFALTSTHFSALGPPASIRRLQAFAYPAGDMQQRVLLKEFAVGSFTLPIALPAR